MERLIIGWGNPIVGDDRFGWEVVENLRSRIRPEENVELVQTSLAGTRLVERMLGHRWVALIDAVVCDDHPPGTIIRRDLVKALAGHVPFSPVGHGDRLLHALRRVRTLAPQSFPEEILLYGCAIGPQTTWVEGTEPAVHAAAETLAEELLCEIRERIAIG
jgi:hydrogenase maturation protease